MSNTLFPAPNELSPVCRLSVYTEVFIFNLNKHLPHMDHSWTLSFCLGFTVCFGLVTTEIKKNFGNLLIYLLFSDNSRPSRLLHASFSPTALFSSSSGRAASLIPPASPGPAPGRGGPGCTWPEHLWVLEASWPDAQNTSVESFDTGHRDIY